MRHYLILIIIIFSGCLQNSANSSELEVTNINLKCENHLSIPYHYIEVDIEKKLDSIIVHANTKPLYDSIKWDYSRIDTFFNIKKTSFDKLVKLVKKLNASDLNSTSTTIDDGSDFTISYGNSSFIKSFSVSTPTYNSEKRKTKLFSEASREILNISGIIFK